MENEFSLDFKKIKYILYTFGFCIFCMSACSVLGDDVDEVKLKELDLQIELAKQGKAGIMVDTVMAKELKIIREELKRLKSPNNAQNIYVNHLAESECDVHAKRQKNRSFWYIYYEFKSADKKDNYNGFKTILIDKPHFHLKAMRNKIKPNLKNGDYLALTFVKELTYEAFYNSEWNKEKK